MYVCKKVLTTNKSVLILQYINCHISKQNLLIRSQEYSVPEILRVIPVWTEHNF